jgi:hypothetical protein
MEKVFFGLIAVFFSQGCTDSDTENPTLRVIDLSPAPQTTMVCGEFEDQVVTLSSGQYFDITFRLTDNRELSQYKLDIHNNFDCHGHSRMIETTDWYVLDIKDLTGMDETISRQIQVPTDVTAGTYHFSIQATDALGNSAESFIYSLNVINSDDIEAPILSLTEPSTQGFSIQKGNSINFQGLLTDNNSLGNGGNGSLEIGFWQIPNQTEIELYQEQFNSQMEESYYFNFDATIPITTADGTYVLEVRSFDAVNNPSNSIQFTVEVI